MGVRHWRATALAGATALLAGAALAGCSADSTTDTTSVGAAPAAAPALENAESDKRAAADTDRAAQQGADSAAQPAGGTAPQQGADQPADAPDLRVDQRAIIYTGSITVRVKNVDEAAAKVTAIATAAGGFVAADRRTSSRTQAGDASVELRVPAAKFASVVDQLATGIGGTEEDRSINTQDVTEETVDLDARIATQQARVDSGRRLLAQAKSLSDLVMLEGELARREADLASLTAKKRRLADLTALSTITAVLLNPDAKTNDDDNPAGFLAGLKDGWNALATSLGVLLTVLGAVLPWVLFLGLPAWGMYWLIRRFGRPGTRPALAAPGSAPMAAHPAVPSPPAPSPKTSTED